MTKRQNITIPDGLGDRLEKVKQRINVSRVCQEALERAVDREEFLNKGAEEMEAVIERLKSEKDEYNERFEKDGFEDGYTDAKGMNYEELQDLGDDLRAIANEPHLEWGAESVCRSLAWDNWLKDEMRDREDCVRERGEGFDQEHYLIGWLKGVAEFWAEVEEQL